jgi:hypothetical protein
MNARREGPGGTAPGKREVRRGKAVSGIAGFKKALFVASESEGALRLFDGMVQRHPVLNSSVTAADAPQPEGVTVQSVREGLTDDVVRAKTDALTTLYYEWNHRAFVKIPMRDTLQLLLRVGREKENHLLDFVNQERFKTFGAQDAAALASAAARAADEIPDGIDCLPMPAVFNDDADLEVELEDLPTGVGFGFGGGIGLGIGGGFAEPWDNDEVETFIDA